jgi:hypothetical protein
MSDERIERLKKLAADMEELGMREEAHDMRNMIGQAMTWRTMAKTLDAENQQLRGRLAELLGKKPQH